MRFEDLDPAEQLIVREDELVWRRAHAIVGRHPHLDVSGVYHTLINLKRTPDERLARSLALGRAYSSARRA